MQHEIKPTELLFLWRLAAAGGGDWLKDVKPDPGAPPRKRLEASGLIAQVKQRPPGGRAQATRVSLTDDGWAWLGGHLDADIRTRSTAGAEVLGLLLARLKTFLDRKNLSIGDLMALWTNDRWVSTVHRVVNPPPEEGGMQRRQSLAFFHQSNWFAEIACLPSCLKAGEEPKYAPVLSGPYLMGKFKSTVTSKAG